MDTAIKFLPIFSGVQQDQRNEISDTSDFSGMETLLTDAHQRGMEYGYISAMNIANRNAVCAEREVSNARMQWVTEESDRLRDQITIRISEVESDICTQVAEILRGFLSTSIRTKSVKMLSRVVGEHLREKSLSVDYISGPEDLVDGLLRAIGDMEYSTGPKRIDNPGELVACVGKTTFKTRINEWQTILLEQSSSEQNDG